MRPSAFGEAAATTVSMRPFTSAPSATTTRGAVTSTLEVRSSLNLDPVLGHQAALDGAADDDPGSRDVARNVGARFHKPRDTRSPLITPSTRPATMTSSWADQLTFDHNGRSNTSAFLQSGPPILNDDGLCLANTIPMARSSRRVTSTRRFRCRRSRMKWNYRSARPITVFASI